MQLSIRYKATIFLLLLVLVGGGIATYSHINSRIQARFEEMQTRAYSMAQMIGLLFTNQLLTGKSVNETLQIQMDVWLSEIPQTEYLVVFDSRGEIIYSTRGNSNLNLKLPPKKFNRTMHSQKQQISRVNSKKHLIDMLIPIKQFHTDFGLIRLGYNMDRFSSDRNTIIIYYGVVGSIILVFTFIFTNYVAGMLIEQIEELERVTTRLGEGDLSARSEVNTGDEIERLGENFNVMAEKLEERINDLRTIQELNKRISAKLRPEDLYDHIINVLYETWELNHINLLLYNDSKNQLKVTAGLNVTKNQAWKREDNPELFHQLEEIKEYESTAKKIKGVNIRQLFNLSDQTPLSEILIFRLKTESFNLGYLLLALETRDFTKDEINLISILSDQIQIALENTKHYTRAVTDDLTELYNRRFFDLQLQKELKEPEKPTSLAMIDIDDFKHYNDSFGHPAGDEVLRKLAQTFEEQVRTADTYGTARDLDTVCRYGGEEFSIILPNTELEDAVTVSQRIREAVANIEIFEIQVTISVGVAEQKNGEDSESLINRADEALYQAKKKGKNRVCRAE